jgi:hypothetical protein
MEADGSLLAEFIDALFRYADEGTFVSLRAFYDDRDGVFGIRPACLSGGLEPLLAAAGRFAMDCASAPARVVFAPPVATFDNEKRADEASLANGLALSVECDRAPGPARLRLESLLGTATVVVESGGEWLDEATGEPQRKLHLHWRLAEPTRDPDAHAQLKEARALATALVGGDPSNKPAVHPIRWPGSWHRKGAPRLATIASLHPDTEIELSDALELLREAATAAGVGGSSPKASLEAASAPLSGEERDTAELVRAVVGGEDYHGPVAALAMRFLKGGVPDAQAVLLLRGIMRAVPEPLRDLKDGQAEAGRWRARYDDIPRAVSTARSKLAAGEGACDPDAWPEPLDFLAEAELTGVPELRAEHLPDALASFVFDTAPRMGVDPAAVALAALVSCASVASDEWALQPKRRDTSWTENPRLWGAIVGDP